MIMSKIKSMTYIKDNGDYSRRQVIVISEPRENYLVLDVTKLRLVDQQLLTENLSKLDEFRDEFIQEFEIMTGVSYNSLWRSFKPGGIEWEQENEI